MKKAYKLNLVWKTVLATRLRLIYETSEHENVSSVHVITLITRISSVIGTGTSGNIVLIILIQHNLMKDTNFILCVVDI